MTKDSKMSMMRVSSELVEDLKLLKLAKSSSGKLGTHNNIVHSLVKAEMRKTHAHTKNGYIAEGAVVRGPSGKPVVIGKITEAEVVFTDGTYLINGGTACYDMELLAASVEEFDGGLIDE
jgi:mannose-1-phosphate guanylyltransferase